MDQVRIGLIGCGMLGRQHAQCLARIPQAKLVACADIVEAAAQKLADDFAARYATTDAQRVIDDQTIDAIYICTRHDSHAPLSVAALESGKHVLVEKPLAMTVPECERIARAVAASGRWLMPAFKMRYYPLIQQAHAFIPQPQVLIGQIMDARWSDDKWTQDPVQGGANVLGQGCHMTDLLRHLAGSEPARIWAAGGALTHPGHLCVDQCVASIAFANGHVASWIASDAGQPAFTSKFFVQLFRDGKSVQIHDRFKKAVFSDGRRSWTEERPEEEGFQLENQAFIEAIGSGRSPELTVTDGLQATRMALLAVEAIRTGQVQTL